MSWWQTYCTWQSLDCWIRPVWPPCQPLVTACNWVTVPSFDPFLCSGRQEQGRTQEVGRGQTQAFVMFKVTSPQPSASTTKASLFCFLASFLTGLFFLVPLNLSVQIKHFDRIHSKEGMCEDVFSMFGNSSCLRTHTHTHSNCSLFRRFSGWFFSSSAWLWILSPPRFAFSHPLRRQTQQRCRHTTKMWVLEALPTWTRWPAPTGPQLFSLQMNCTSVRHGRKRCDVQLGLITLIGCSHPSVQC